MLINDVLNKAVDIGASDIFVVAGKPISFRVNSQIESLDEQRLLPSDAKDVLVQLYQAAERDITELNSGDDEFSFSLPGMARFRVSAFMQRGTYSAVIRVVRFVVPNNKDLGISDYVANLGLHSKGMILVTGPAGNGKSTTMACMIDAINKNLCKHIITIEDPIEYLHRHDKSIVTQREISLDTESYIAALRASLRQSPDVILLGEMRDYETISVAMTAAETGHLLFSTLHTIGAANTISRIVDVFPANQQAQINVQLSMVLTAVISQQLVPAIGGGVALAMEVMTVTPAIRNMIRENKIHQIDSFLYANAREDMKSMDSSLLELYKNGKISKDVALEYAINAEMLAKRL